MEVIRRPVLPYSIEEISRGVDLASIFRGRRSTLDRWSGKIAKRIGTRLSVLHPTFHC